MDTNNTDARLKEQVLELEQTLEKLMLISNRLFEDNQSLKLKETQLIKDRAELHAKNDKIRTQVEAMIMRLKAMENS
ncbi:TIGR02449 family protein [Leucothrix arctica]|uniref:TIGR02449 family protein n=1 Tax=Leucothrix arctica TaxID=1481894 RepID=A0A317CB69_9GAMM|nr:TIGR02449 family protein [Leucothrix arctica]PWQ94563.1 TIGR02449 family protein [Leucothrix arctica]